MYLMEGLLSLGISVTASFLYESAQNKVSRLVRAIKFHVKIKNVVIPFSQPEKRPD